MAAWDHPVCCGLAGDTAGVGTLTASLQSLLSSSSRPRPGRRRLRPVLKAA